MKSEELIRELLEQYEFDRRIEAEYGIENDAFTRKDLIISVLKWVLDEDK